MEPVVVSSGDLAAQFLRTLLAFVLGGSALIVLARLVGRQRQKAEPDAGAAEPAALRTPFWLRLSTLLGLAVAVFVPAYVGAWAWAAVVTLLVWLGLGELWAALEAAGAPAHRRVGYAAGVALPVAALVAGPESLAPALGAGFLLVATRSLFAASAEALPARLGATWLGACYVGLLGAFLVLIQRSGELAYPVLGAGGFGALVFFLMVVQLADVGGLMGGILFGRRKLVPRLSPGKTWEGLVGSVAAAALAAWAFAFALPNVPVPWLLVVGVVLAVAGLVGDLLASGFKRAAGLKDFGHILPGHGGVLDRFDGYIFTAPLYWLCLEALTWALGGGGVALGLR